MNSNLHKLLTHLKSTQYPSWNYHQGSPLETFPVLWPEKFRYDTIWDCIEFIHLPPNSSPSEELAKHFGVSVRDYNKLFIFLDDDEADPPDKERFIEALEEYLASSIS